MKFICNTEEFANATSTVSKAIAAKPNIPILEGIKLSVEGDVVTISATDLELFIETKIKASVKIEGECVVNGKFLNEFVKKLTYLDEIELEKLGNSLSIKYGDNETEIQCLEEDTYPEIRKVSDEVFFKVKEGDLKEAIDAISYCVAQDDNRPILKGILLDLAGETLTTVALDGYRLGYAKCEVVDSSKGEYKIIIPGKTLAEISKILEEGDKIIKVTMQKNIVLFDLGNTIITTRLIDGDYIDYKKLIPTTFTTHITIEKDALMSGLDRASLVAKKHKHNYLKLSISGNVMEINSNSDISKIRETVNCALEGKDLDIAFNSRFLADALNKIKEDFIDFKFSGATSPTIIVPKEGDKFLYMVLPIRMLG
ncbi:MAG: DNA polymerase III subunit beta [Clostridia bacterium]|nr:DNA polymerase III subunit beta [Clostridia bacterium]MBO7178386.1 DNA polymerase III subunit beta [Clostridia bacterium]